MTKFFTLDGREFDMNITSFAPTMEIDGRVYDRESHFQPKRVCCVFVERGAQRSHLLEFRIRLALERAHPVSSEDMELSRAFAELEGQGA
jgi:hypothetical protein